MNIAITAEPIRWIGNKLSIKQANAAMPTDNITPGISFNTFIDNSCKNIVVVSIIPQNNEECKFFAINFGCFLSGLHFGGKRKGYRVVALGNYSKNAITQATTTKNDAAIPKHPEVVLLGVV